MEYFDICTIDRKPLGKIVAGMWECTAGSVLADEKSLDAIIREVKEEIGINVNFIRKPITEYIEGNAIFDLWVTEIDYDIEELVLQKEEVDDAKFVTLKEVKNIIISGNATKSLNELLRLNNIGLISLSES